MYPLVRELAADGIPIAVTCRVLKIARQPYYRWLATPITDAELRAAYRSNALFDAHRDDPEFGYRFLVDEALEAGEPMAERTAWKICSDLGWWSSHGKKRGGNGKKPGPPVHDDLCAITDRHGVTRHEFKSDRPNELWLSDITEHPTREGKVYCCVVLDTYSRRVVGWSIDASPNAALVTNALGMAIDSRLGQRQDAGTIIHSDQGVQFGSWAFTRRAKESGLLASMGSIGDCYDNSMIESFWSRMQVELLDRKKWNTRIELSNAMFEYLEIWHNRKRRHSRLGWLTPVEFERNRIITVA